MIWSLPKISIVTPSFNQVEFIEATIQSVLSQEYPNFEYIVIDGGSTDGSVEIIKKYEGQLHFWCSKADAGQYDAINQGLAHSTGEIMAWLNSDDMYYPWTLKTVASIMSDLPQVEWLTTLTPGFWDWHGFCTGFGSIPGYSREAFLAGNYVPYGKNAIGWIQQESTFWRRILWQKAGSHIRNGFKLAGDFDLWSRFFLHTDLYGTISPLGGFRSQVNQQSNRQREQYIAEAEKSLATMRELLGWSPQFIRDIMLQSKLKKAPKIANIIESLYGYIGHRVVRENMNSPDSFWRTEEYKFLY